ncbi:MAG: hypothetical protein KDK28_00405 [Maritimibacter sp.]|nr:hypothetical protein [Maritimibacter sp.]
MGRSKKLNDIIMARVLARTENCSPPDTNPVHFRACAATRAFSEGKRLVCDACPPDRCRRMFEIGLDDLGAPLSIHERPKCGAKTRKGDLCAAKVVPGKRRCEIHGGLSTGPRTATGRARIADAQRRRWEKAKAN